MRPTLHFPPPPRRENRTSLLIAAYALFLAAVVVAAVEWNDVTYMLRVLLSKAVSR